MKNKIKVLIVDDALFMRKAISEILSSDSDLEIVGTASDGMDGLEKIKSLRPDVITLDIDMPRMDGLEAIRHIMIESPVPVVVLSSLFSDGAVTFEALRLGVFDFIPKPSGAIVEDMDKSRRQIIDRVKLASSVNFKNIRRVKMNAAERSAELQVFPSGTVPLEYLIAVGTNISGPNTVIRLLSRLSPSLPASIIVMKEIAPQILPSFVKKFDEHVPWGVKIAEDGMVLEQGIGYICSNEYSVSVERNENNEPYMRVSKPVDNPLDLMFSTAADVFKKNTVGVLLTGVGVDGSDGFSYIQNNNGITIAQDAQCCVYPNLTSNAIEKGTVTSIANERQLPQFIENSFA
ncbi:MAG: chemotaxis protein CheB [Desulfobacteraceae bacterium]|nr:chemotaxis protein CheB [Desulfobacteraceae bacterium]